MHEVFQVGPGNDILAITLSIAPVNAVLFWIMVQHLTLVFHSVISGRFSFATIPYKNITAGAMAALVLLLWLVAITCVLELVFFRFQLILPRRYAWQYLIEESIQMGLIRIAIINHLARIQND